MGHELRSGQYKSGHISDDEIWANILNLYSPETKYSTSYKFAFFNALLDNVEYTTFDRFIRFDQLFDAFTKSYWPIVTKYQIKQMPGKLHSSVEQIINEFASKKECEGIEEYESLNEIVRNRIVEQVKKRCKNNVVGAVYSDTGEIVYSFSVEEEWIQLNPIVQRFLSEEQNKRTLKAKNIDEWAKYLFKIADTHDKSIELIKDILQKDVAEETQEDITSRSDEISENVESLEIRELKDRYKNNKAENYTQLLNENSDIDFKPIKIIARDVYETTITELLRKLGVIKTPKEKLDDITKELIKRYIELGKTEQKLTELINKNKDIVDIARINEYTQSVLSRTAKDYLLELGIIKEERIESVPVEKKLEEVVSKLKERYSSRKAFNLKEVETENKDLNISGINGWTRELFDKSAKAYLVELGIIESIDRSWVRELLSHDHSITTLDSTTSNKGDNKESYYQQSISAINELIGIIEGINYDGIVNEYEVEKLSEWIDCNAEYLRDTKYATFVLRLEDILSDGVVDDNERDYLIRETYKVKSDIRDIKRSLEVLRGILNGVICDNAIADEEVYRLHEWVENNARLSGVPIYDHTRKVINNILDDDVISEKEKDFFLLYISNIIDSGSNSATQNQQEECLDISHEDLTQLIYAVLEEKRELKAKHIAKMIPGTKKIDVNRVLYSKENEGLFVQTDSFGWRLGCEPLNKEEEGVLKELLNDDYEDLKMIRQQFYKRIVGAKIDKINDDNLEKLGYRISGNIAYRKKYDSIGQSLRAYVSNRELIDLSDKNYMFSNAQVNITLSKLKNEHKIVEFDEHKYITTARLNNMGITEEMMDDYCHKARAFSNGEYFNNHSLVVNGFNHPLYEYGFESLFYETLLRSYGQCAATCINGTYVFVDGKKARGIPDIVENEVMKEESIDIYDMIDFFQTQYGIKIQIRKLTNRLNDADVFYSDTMEKIYIDYDTFFEEV